MIQAYFASHLVEYEHHKVRLSLARLFESARNKVDMCYANLRKSDVRESLFHYSDPVAMVPGPRLYVLKGSPIESLAKDGSISLVVLLSSGMYQGVAEKGRSFGAAIQQVLFDHGASMHLAVAADVAYKYEMLANGRVDFFIEYPFVVGRYARVLSETLNLTSLKIDEHKSFTSTYVVCTKTDFGRQVIENINEVIRSEKGSAAHRGVLMSPARDMGAQGRREYELLCERFLNGE